ncbi:L28 family ribosomal protein [Meiothermus sp.]|jgi:large subunit ribosomal protein L28|uniref:large ribosomal subunit protein bL28 n=1 Tax=Meiothermus sp. TaxID=1955249 RepID=UPI0021DBEFC5|nr:L28 family ribosomal protein [Meiothermus sp.]GIW24578.1 MAG: 50S ribosomal protein L28 [Meiothermus sp.]
MSKICEISGKRPTVAYSIITRGKAKREGGVGKKITGYTKHWQEPNLRKVTVMVAGQPITFRVANSHTHKVYELVERSKGMKLEGLTAKQIKARLLSLL